MALLFIAGAGLLDRPPMSLAQRGLSGLPSVNEADGRFLGVAGTGLRTFPASTTTNIFIGIPAGQSSFRVEIYDGDLGGRFDLFDPATAGNARVSYTLFADPLKNGAGRQVIANQTDQAFADATWQTLFSGTPAAAARAPSGNFFDRLEVGWVDPSQSATAFNSYKVRADGQLNVGPGQWSFAGAPLNLGVDPAFGSGSNAYDGSWLWYLEVLTAGTVTTKECDADPRTDPTSPGNPPDDELTDARVRIPPDVRYTFSAPDGSLLVFNVTPSGSDVCQTRTYAGQPTGFFPWRWSGVDAHNLIYYDLPYHVYASLVTPLAIDAATPTVTSTPTNTSVPPSATATNSAVPATATGTGVPAISSTPGASATATITATATGSAGPMSTATVTASSTPTSQSGQPSPTATNQPSGGGGGGTGSGGGGGAPPATATATPTETSTGTATPRPLSPLLPAVVPTETPRTATPIAAGAGVSQKPAPAQAPGQAPAQVPGPAVAPVPPWLPGQAPSESDSVVLSDRLAPLADRRSAAPLEAGGAPALTSRGVSGRTSGAVDLAATVQRLPSAGAVLTGLLLPGVGLAGLLGMAGLALRRRRSG